MNRLAHSYLISTLRSCMKSNDFLLIAAAKILRDASEIFTNR